MTNDRKVAAERSSLLWAAEVVRLLVSLGVLALLTRVVRPEVLGTYLAVTSVVLVVPRLLDLGLPHALGYFLRIAPAGLRASSVVLARHVGVTVPIALAAAYCMQFIPFASDNVASVAKDYWAQLGLLIVFELAILLGLGCFIPTGRFKAYLLAVVAPPVLLFTSIALWPRGQLTAGSLLNLLLAASLVGAAIVIVLLWRAGPALRAAFPTADAYRYGLRSYGAAVSKFVAQRFDRLFLVTVLGAAGFAQYSLAISIRDMATLPANLYATTLRNRQIDLIARDKELAAARTLLIRQSLGWLGLGLASAAVMYPFWTPLVRWMFGAQFEPTAGFLKIVAFSGAPIAIMGFAWNHLYALQRPGRVTVLTTGSLAVALPTFLLFIHAHGPSVGVAIAVVIWSALASTASLVWAMTSGTPDAGTPAIQ